MCEHNFVGLESRDCTSCSEIIDQCSALSHFIIITLHDSACINNIFPHTEVQTLTWAETNIKSSMLGLS